MNIAEAKQQVRDALRAYLSKDEYGNYLMPLESQRPVFLMGPPGIGKTAIVHQVADELGIGLVSYSMTHHTRQSALGLPYIAEAEFDGRPERVTRYTMSEIVASVHEMIESTGRKEGILFLDEVNCVSETLAPVMLQFLQFKMFGQHRIPQGWLVACAGNPPEYNNSVREFDIVTWDRLKRIDIEPDYAAWREYALRTGVHPSVLSYLELNKHHFYQVESTAQGKRFVTARGWVDLSNMLKLYEHNGIEADANLVVQYLQDDEVAHAFAASYRLYVKYGSDYRVEGILDGTVAPDIMERASNAGFDERLALVHMVFGACVERAVDATGRQEALGELLKILLAVRDARAKAPVDDLVAQHVARVKRWLERSRAAGQLGREEELKLSRVLAFLERARAEVASGEGADLYELLKAGYNSQVSELRQHVARCTSALDNAFEFFETVFGDGQEMLVFVTNLTANRTAASFISEHGCDKYFEHSEQLMFHERRKDILQALDELGL